MGKKNRRRESGKKTISDSREQINENPPYVFMWHMRRSMEGRFASKCRLGPPLVPGGLPSLEIGAKLVRDIRDVRQGKYSTRKNEAVEART